MSYKGDKRLGKFMTGKHSAEECRKKPHLGQIKSSFVLESLHIHLDIFENCHLCLNVM